MKKPCSISLLVSQVFSVGAASCRDYRDWRPPTKIFLADQVALRAVLALSTPTGRSFRAERVRQNRPIPGLKPQHQAALRAPVRSSKRSIPASRSPL